MLTTAPHLEVRRPSPTTAEFTVTTCPPPTISNRLLLALVFVLRVLLAASVLFLLYLTWPLATLPASTSTTTTTSPEYAQFPGSILWRIHTTESLLVLRGLGIQTTSSSSGATLALALAGGAGAGGGSTTRFIPTEKIRDVLINEAFRGFAVRYYLVVVVDGEEDVVVVFPRLLPGRRIVERVWRGVRGCLWEPQEGGWDSGG
ncbi:GPI-GlcNAc transferase complex, PIG-H component-domain-containing protein [Coniella lustricola]|uniref:GPI-GlcNAc transferase complex, PIG-H component-domain-containing protein n=1 Tax=Coniella lustricola TaxID=2025994 RepID=A0A2T3A939_9PEZI|nr:GPI-GlcNAc transferase complex, PIG-H component-domain-containing protein [Coniella lustricola]